MKKYALPFIFVFLAMALFISNSFAVIFANEGMYLFEKRHRVMDSSVIYTLAGVSEKYRRFKVCKNGLCVHRQTPKENKILFFKTKNPNILTEQEWWALGSDKRPNAETYNKYLEGQAQGAIYSKVITIPDVKGRKIHSPPQEGMTGGVVGSSRSFVVDLITGEIIQRK